MARFAAFLATVFLTGAFALGDGFGAAFFFAAVVLFTATGAAFFLVPVFFLVVAFFFAIAIHSSFNDPVSELAKIAFFHLFDPEQHERVI
jgi:preprotein translocase subunit SecG